MNYSKSGLVASKKECMLTNDIISLPNMTGSTEKGKNYLIILAYTLEHNYMQV